VSVPRREKAMAILRTRARVSRSSPHDLAEIRSACR
jgi:hypothetical protein